MNKNIRPLVYFAAPLFSEAELSFNLHLTTLLESTVDVYLPQRDGGRLVDLLRDGVSSSTAYATLFERDMDAITRCDALLIVLDGRTIDEGAVFELGIAYALGKLCLGYQSDPRRLLPVGNNLMIACALEKVFADSADLMRWIRGMECRGKRYDEPRQLS